MLLIPETGEIVAGANSYVSVDYADSYFEGHPFHADNWADLDPDMKAHLLIAATSSLDQLFNWFGQPVSAMQSLRWPRMGVLISERYAYLPHTSIPEDLKKATCEMAFYLSKGDQFAASGSEGIESLKIDVIELQFAASTKAKPVPAHALLLLRTLGEYAYGRGHRKVIV